MTVPKYCRLMSCKSSYDIVSIRIDMHEDPGMGMGMGMGKETGRSILSMLAEGVWE